MSGVAESCAECGDDGWMQGSEGSPWQEYWYCRSCWEEFDRNDMTRREEEQARAGQEEDNHADVEERGEEDEVVAAEQDEASAASLQESEFEDEMPPLTCTLLSAPQIQEELARSGTPEAQADAPADVKHTVENWMRVAEEHLRVVPRLWKAVDALDCATLESFSVNDLNLRRQDGATPLLAVLSTVTPPLQEDSPAHQVITNLLNRHINVQAQNWLGESALQLAARLNNVALVKALLQMHANTNLCDRFSETPLTEAVVTGSVDVVHLLLHRKAHVMAEDIGAAQKQRGDHTIERALLRAAKAQGYDPDSAASQTPTEFGQVAGDLPWQVRQERAALCHRQRAPPWIDHSSDQGEE
mmetsp:Transcript_54489/g.100789  ORF Transcript_54489/g.100789 Transcript_54489/m.100789 type:complete len:357 (-) Transcript_54489:57-1127(-)